MSEFDRLTIAKYIGTTTVSIICAYGLYKVIEMNRLIRKYRHIPGPKPEGLKGFILGNIPEIFEAKDKGLNIQQYFEKQIDKYGYTFTVRLMNQVAVVTIDPHFIKNVFIDDDYPKCPWIYRILGFPQNERFMGDGLVTETDHAAWKEHRIFLNPGFQRQALMKFMKEFNSTGDVFMNYLRKFADGKTLVKLLDEFNRATLDNIAKVAFSMNVDSVTDRNNVMIEDIKKSFELVEIVYEDPSSTFNPFMWNKIHKGKTAIRRLRKIGHIEVTKRIKAMKNGDPVPDDILTTILTNSTQDKIDIQLLVDDFVTFFVAGQETTATALSFVFRELGRNPEVLTKLQHEIDTVLGAKAEITYQDLTELKYTAAVFREALRMYPPVTDMSRCTREDIKMEKFLIPKDTWILASTYISGRREEFYPDPLKFKPERFLKDENSSETNSCYTSYPFSLGTRNCIGQNFAQMEAKILIAKFLQNFDFKLDPNERFTEFLNGTLQPQDGTKCFIKFR